MSRYEFNATERSLMEQSTIPFAIYQFIDKHVVTLIVSDGFCKLFGYEQAEAYFLMDHDMYRDTHPDDVSRIADAAYRFAVEDCPYDVVYRTKADSGYKIVHARGEHRHTDDGKRIAIIMYFDAGAYDPESADFDNAADRIANYVMRDETATQASRYDQLTGLPNMSRFLELAEARKARLLEKGDCPAFIFLNLRGMKFFNDRHGFAAGDDLLKSVAKVLARNFGNESCGRLAQDHFGVCVSSEHVEETLSRVFAECASINDGKGLPIRAGIYLDRVDSMSASAACDRAKYACDLSRSYLSGYRYFDESALKRAQNQRYIIDNLDRALDEGWIQVHFQPIVRSASGLVCDEEALSRWIDPERGLIPPDVFIPVLEESRLIKKLDLYVVDKVLAKLKHQSEAGLHVVPQSVNLSRVDFDKGDIVEEIRAKVDAAGIPHDRLTIEVTESMVGSDFAFMKTQIERFKDLGFHVWMDDFGSGYSSLDMLHNIRFDLIKLDRQLMERFETSEEGKIIITELVRMAANLGLDTVAEGVETQEQATFLKEIGCSRMQGFYYCKPVSFEEILERYEKGTQIGLESPDDAPYFAAIGKINLYDMAAISKEGDARLKHYFDTVPMGIIETDGRRCWITRANKTYRAYMKETFDADLTDAAYEIVRRDDNMGDVFYDALLKCSVDGVPVMLDEDLGNGGITHVYLRRIAQNPVSGMTALAIAVLAVIENENSHPPITFGNIAKALSADYRYLYYVDLDTDDFVEYSSTGMSSDLSTERHGDDFFAKSREDARRILYEPDQEKFIRAFTKEHVVGAIDANGTFTIRYRLIIDGEPRYMNMKAMRMSPNDNHIIIGVNDIDAHMKRQETFDRIRHDHKAYMRLNALTDEFLAVYVVDPKTRYYAEHSATGGYSRLGLVKAGDNFFERALEESQRALSEEDVERFKASFTEENIMSAIERYGKFELTYHLLIDGKPTPVTLKAVMVKEDEGERLIIGVR